MKTLLVASFLALSLSGCASLFSSDSGPVIAPVPTAKQNWLFATRWDRSVGKGELNDFNDLSPLAVGETLYTSDPSGRVLALNKTTGDIQWEQELKLPLSTGWIFDNDSLFAGTRDGQLVALKAADGAELWRKPLSSELLSLPAVANQLVVTHNADGRVMAFDQSSGQLRWRYDRDLPELSLRGESRPVLVNGGAVLGFANGKVGVLLLKDGQLAWEQRISDPQGRSQVQRLADVDATVLVAGNEVFVAGYQGNLSSLDLLSGQVHWQSPLSSYRDAVLDDERVYAVTADGSIKALDRSTGKVIWSQTELSHRQLSAPVLVAGCLMVGDFEGYLHCLNPQTGDYVSNKHLGGGGINMAPVVAGDSLLVLTRNGQLYSLALATTP